MEIRVILNKEEKLWVQVMKICAIVVNDKEHRENHERVNPRRSPSQI
jgi:hypothetical protein